MKHARIGYQVNISVEHLVIIGLEKILKEKTIVGISGQVQRHYENVRLIPDTESEIIANWPVRDVVSSSWLLQQYTRHQIHSKLCEI